MKQIEERHWDDSIGMQYSVSSCWLILQIYRIIVALCALEQIFRGMSIVNKEVQFNWYLLIEDWHSLTVCGQSFF